REAREAAERAAAEREAKAAAEREAKAAAEREAKAAAERAELEAKKASEQAVPAVEVVPPAAPEWTPAAAAGDSRGGDAAAASGVYRLAKGDIVQIALRGIPESQLIDDSLDEFGMISLPFINEVKAEGLTASELEQRIRNQYRDDQIYPNVTVQVQVPTRYYFMQGEIRGPGRVQLVTATRLSQAIAASGGGTEFWNGKVLLRRNGEIYRKIKNARKLEKTPEDDVLLEPGDIVELMRSIF
ncbi:MAG: polysaccharide biosynthesis/export family protein, partial [Kiritimatiellae bacterium]|nr:polysaccharide biosynthesis/export family protein [Kiritimatiellia bacterium]